MKKEQKKVLLISISIILMTIILVSLIGGYFYFNKGTTQSVVHVGHRNQISNQMSVINSVVSNNLQKSYSSGGGHK